MAVGWAVLTDFLEDTYGSDNLGNVSVKAAKSPDGNEVFHLHAGIRSSGIMLKTATVEAGASLMHILQSNGLKVEQVDYQILKADAAAFVGRMNGGTDARLELEKGEASVFGGTLVLGVDTGVGIKDESLTVKVLGTAHNPATSIDIPVLGTSVEVDFGKLVDFFLW